MKTNIIKLEELLEYSDSKTLFGGITAWEARFLFAGQLKKLIHPNVDMIALAINYTVCKRDN